MDRTWKIEIEGKKHIIEMDYATDLRIDELESKVIEPKDGKLVVDGNEVRTWKSEPKEISFEIGGKPAVLRRKGFLSTKLELFFEGQLIKSS